MRLCMMAAMLWLASSTFDFSMGSSNRGGGGYSESGGPGFLRPATASVDSLSPTLERPRRWFLSQQLQGHYGTCSCVAGGVLGVVPSIDLRS